MFQNSLTLETTDRPTVYKKSTADEVENDLIANADKSDLF